LAVAVLVPFSLVVVSYNGDQKMPRELTKRKQRVDGEKLPVIYTYFEGYNGIAQNKKHGDVALLQYWSTAWDLAGWEPRILTEKDAEKHPDYEELIAIITDRQPAGEENCVSQYDMACYKRWIAMAAVGGGFMTDNDVFPLNDFRVYGNELPNDGKLTVWEQWVPAIVSGSSEEYRRIAQRIAEVMGYFVDSYYAGNQLRRNKCGSDMLSLEQLKRGDNPEYILAKRVQPPQMITEWTDEACESFQGSWGVHFSHAAMNHILKKPMPQRGRIGYDFFDSYRKNCKTVIEEIPPKPVMYTYFDSYKTAEVESKDKDRVLLAYWSAAWSLAGWEPRILNENDAEKHPDYERLMAIVTDRQPAGENCVSQYDMACYKRWIAMAAAGGGFMSDYDVFPMNDFRAIGEELPNDGNLTIWENSWPSLVSGSNEEYRRISQRIGEVMANYIDSYYSGDSSKTANKKCGSDIISLGDLYNKEFPELIQKERVYGPQPISEWTDEVCQKYKDAWGVHLGPTAMYHELKAPFRERGTKGLDFFREYRENCRTVTEVIKGKTIPLLGLAQKV